LILPFLASSLPALAVPSVTWIKVDRPTFDLVGVVLTSLGLAGICAGVALTFGAVVGISLIVRGRRALGAPAKRVSLHLAEAPPN
jgi:hypothetical protein